MDLASRPASGSLVSRRMAQTGRDELSDRIGRLDNRRKWAQRRAPVWFVITMFFVALTWGLGVLVVMAMLARGWSWITGQGFSDVALWGWAPEAIAAVTILLIAAVFLALFQAGFRGVSHKAMLELGGLTEPASGTRIDNLAAELAIGLGVTPPALRILDDPAPNALSIPHRKWGPTLVVTTGTDRLARDELEAMIAHELVHCHAPDARWAAAAQWGVARARAAGHALGAIGGALLLLAFAGLYYADLFLPTPFAGGLGLVALAIALELVVGPVARKLRGDADQLADVGAVRLARHPEAFGRLCDKVAADDGTVAVKAHHLDHLWFKEVADEPDVAGRELRARADAAYAAAGVARPHSGAS